MRPTLSWPRITGNGIGNSPFHRWTSVPQIPAIVTRTRASPGPTCAGTGYSRNSSGSRARTNTAALADVRLMQGASRTNRRAVPTRPAESPSRPPPFQCRVGVARLPSSQSNGTGPILVPRADPRPDGARRSPPPHLEGQGITDAGPPDGTNTRRCRDLVRGGEGCRAKSCRRRWQDPVRFCAPRRSSHDRATDRSSRPRAIGRRRTNRKVDVSRPRGRPQVAAERRRQDRSRSGRTACVLYYAKRGTAKLPFSPLIL